MTELLSDRVKGLLDARNRQQQNELQGVTRGELAKWLGGRDPGTNGLKRLALALDATTDYLVGAGDDYRGGSERDNYALAAAKMSFPYFERHPQVSQEQKRRCRRIFDDEVLLLREGAPRTAEAWRSLAAMLDRAVPIPPKIGAARTA